MSKQFITVLNISTNGGWNFLRTCCADWTWRLEMDWHWLRAEFYTQSPNLVFVGLAGALQVRYSFWPSLSWAIGHSAKKLRPFRRKRWILMNPCLPMAVTLLSLEELVKYYAPALRKIEALVWDLADWQSAANLMGIRRSCSAFGIAKPGFSTPLIQSRKACA